MEWDKRKANHLAVDVKNVQAAKVVMDILMVNDMLLKSISQIAFYGIVEKI